MSNGKSKMVVSMATIVELKSKMSELNDLVFELLDMQETTDKSEELYFIINKLRHEFFIDLDSLKSGHRHKKLVAARQIYCWYMRKHSHLTLKSIGSIIGRDHSTVLHSIQACQDRIDTKDILITEMHNRIFNPKQ